MEKWQRDIKDRFFLDRAPEPTEKGVRIHVRTRTGIKILCGPRWAIEFYSYMENDQTIYEAWIAGWLIEKIGLSLKG